MKENSNIKIIIYSVILILIFAFIFLTGHSNNVSDGIETTTKQETESYTETTTEIPLVSYNDIETGLYNGKTVKVKGVITNVDIISIISDINLNVWIKDENKVIDEGTWFIDDEKVGLDNFTYLSQNLKIGDNCIFTTSINSDSSISSTDIKNVEIIQKDTTLDDIKQIYVSSCANININEFIRNPENYRGKNLKIKGNVFQIVSESSTTVDFLLDTGGNNGILYISYDIPKGFNRVLEGDNITVCGCYYKIVDYKSVLGTRQSVPAINARFLI